jgi:hypothetical protein
MAVKKTINMALIFELVFCDFFGLFPLPALRLQQQPEYSKVCIDNKKRVQLEILNCNLILVIA